LGQIKTYWGQCGWFWGEKYAFVNNLICNHSCKARKKKPHQLKISLVGCWFGAIQKDQNNNHYWQLAPTSKASRLGEGLALSLNGVLKNCSVYCSALNGDDF
jgi:hypothetical protein